MSDTSLLDLGRMIAALVLVIAMMGGLSILLKRLGVAGSLPAASGRKRLKVVDSIALDSRRRLVIVQCDDAQHLLILGPSGETVIKTDIPANDCDSRDDGQSCAVDSSLSS